MGGCCEGSGGFPVVGERGGVDHEGGGRGRNVSCDEKLSCIRGRVITYRRAGELPQEGMEVRAAFS